MKNSVSILIPNWNGAVLLRKNVPLVLDAARELGEEFTELIIVDDGSTDESVSVVKELFPQVRLIEHATNLGFHYATNTGFKNARGNIVILLNSDLYPERDAFAPLIKHFEDPLLFGVSGKIFSQDKTTFLYGNRGAYFKKGHFFLTEKEEDDTSSQNLFVCGGAGAFRKNRFLELGGFDTLYHPFYYEEQDVSYRALKRGWHIAYAPESRMYHQIRGSIGKKMRSKKISYISARNNYLFVIKNITDPFFTIQMIVFIPLFLIRDLFHLKFRFWISFFLAIPRIPKAIFERMSEIKELKLTDREILENVRSPRSYF